MNGIIIADSVSGLVEASKSLADQPDRVWLVFGFLVLGGCTLAVIRWLVRGIEAERKAREALGNRLFDYLEKDVRAVVVRLSENESVMSENTKIMERVERKLNE